jgi:hypothetical protein
MKIRNTLVITLISLLLVVSYMEIVNGDIFKTLHIRQPDRPTVCIFEPGPETANWKLLEAATLMGIYEWEVKLDKLYPDGDWGIIVYTSIPWEEHESKAASDYQYCNIMIVFEKENTKSNAIGTTGIYFNKSYHKYMLISIYLEHSKQSSSISVADGSEGTFKISIGKTVLSPNMVRNVVLHEMGHALGLFHYEITTPLKAGEYGTDRSAMYYAININDKNQILQVKLPEMRMIAELYGEDGWLDKIPPWNIRSCSVINTIVYDCE